MMFWICALMTVAFAGKGEISTDEESPTQVWPTPDAVALNGHAAKYKCEVKPDERAAVPYGARFDAVVVTDCEGFQVAKLVVRGPGNTRYAEYYVDAEHLSLKAPRNNVWDNKKAVGQVNLTSSSTHYAVPLSEHDWLRLPRILHGETLDVLDAKRNVVRTTSGREFALLRGRPKEGAAKPYNAEQGVQQQRFFAGRDLRDPGRDTFAPVPPVGLIKKDQRRYEGVPYVLTVRTGDLASPQYDPDWLEPVGFVLEVECSREQLYKPCGSYYLDLSAFGGWWPRNSKEMMVVLEGTHTVDGKSLPKLVAYASSVTQPSYIRVTSAWDTNGKR